MRVLFWRRKNARFVNRLSNVVETSEHVRKSFRPKPPRVIIDTSFLDTADDEERNADGDLNGYPDEASDRHDGEHEEPVQHDGAADYVADVGFEAETASAESAGEEQSALIGFPREPVSANGLGEHETALDDLSGDFAPVSHSDAEATVPTRAEIEAFEREMAALIEAEREAAAQREAEAKAREEAARLEAEAQRELAARLEAEAQREQAARLAAEAAREEAARRAEQAQRELEEIRAAAAQSEQAARLAAETRQREEAARLEAEAQRELAERLETEAQREQAARRAAELEREEATRRAEDAQRELEALRAAAEQRDIASRREAEAQREQAARLAAEAEREQAARRIEDMQRELEALRAAVEQRELAARQETEARLREEAARREAEAQREEAARRAEEAQRELAQLRALAGLRAFESTEAVAARERIEAARREAEAQREKVPRRAPELVAETVVERPTQSPVPAEASRPGSMLSEVDVVLPSSSGRTEAVLGAMRHEQPQDAADSRGEQSKPREKRIPAQTPATLWHEGMTQPLTCTVRDKSSSGAKVEFSAAGGTDIAEIVVGDQLTLTFNYPRERTSVACRVVWVAGIRCGLRFCGQFHTQAVAPRKSKHGRVIAEAATGGAKSGFGRISKLVKPGKAAKPGKAGLADVVKHRIGNR